MDPLVVKVCVVGSADIHRFRLPLPVASIDISTLITEKFGVSTQVEVLDEAGEPTGAALENYSGGSGGVLRLRVTPGADETLEPELATPLIASGPKPGAAILSAQRAEQGAKEEAQRLQHQELPASANEVDRALSGAAAEEQRLNLLLQRCQNVSKYPKTMESQAAQNAEITLSRAEAEAQRLTLLLAQA